MRPTIALLTITATIVGSTDLHAGCFGNSPSAIPYVVGYAPAGYAPIATPYAANYPVIPAAAIPAAAPVLPPNQTDLAPGLSSGAYQAQRPNYYDNPSVYTGMPVGGGYVAARPAVPAAAPYRGFAAAGSNLSAANQYPSNYVSAYGAAEVPATPMPFIDQGQPISAAPPIMETSQVVPAAAAVPVYQPAPARGCCLARLFGCGGSETSYRSSYYRAPITYYRPATTIDPVLGTTVTVQQPCTSYVQQLQRTPYSSGLQGPAASYGQPTPACSTPNCGNSYSAPSTYSPPGAFSAPVGNGIGQASAIAPATADQFAVPIPSTAPSAAAPGGYYGQNGYPSSTAPLTGPPPGFSNGAQTGNGSQTGNDYTPLQQPELRNRPSSSDNGYQSEQPESDARESDKSESQRPKTESYWQLQNAEDSTAMIRRSQWDHSPAQPIVAPADYVSPFSRQTEAPTTPVKRGDFEAPPLPPRSYDSVDKSHDSNWVSAPVREVSTASPRTYRQTARPIERDTTWKAARN